MLLEIETKTKLMLRKLVHRQTVSVPYTEKTKDGQSVLEYHEEEVQDPVYEAILQQAYRMFQVIIHSKPTGCSR
jgi:hypothetical protein